MWPKRYIEVAYCILAQPMWKACLVIGPNASGKVSSWEHLGEATPAPPGVNLNA